MATIDGDQLRVVQKILGLNQSGLSGITEVDDGNLSQTIPIAPDLLRRGLAPIGSTGWFSCMLQNDHVAAGDIRSAIDPYNPGASALGGFPAAVDEGFDFWVLAIGASLAAGDGSLFSHGQLNVVTPATAMGWAQDDGGGALAPVLGVHNLALWDDIDTTIPAALQPAFLTVSGRTTYYPAMRIRRGGTLNFETEQTGAGLSTINCFMACALMPAALGQDVTS